MNMQAQTNNRPGRGIVVYQYGKTDDDGVAMDYRQFVARVTAHIPAKGQAMVRYYGLYSNAHMGGAIRHGSAGPVMPIVQPAPATRASFGWMELIKKVYEVDPIICRTCCGEMKVIAFITNYEIIDRIIHHPGINFGCHRPTPPHQQNAPSRNSTDEFL